jgi:hypothetical protein
MRRVVVGCKSPASGDRHAAIADARQVRGFVDHVHVALALALAMPRLPLPLDPR